MAKLKNVKRIDSKEAYDKIKAVLIKDLDYNEGEIQYLEKKDILVIKSIIIIAWDEKTQFYCFSVSVTTEPFGFACMLSYLFKNGFLNIRMIDRFYMKSDDDDISQMFIGTDAIHEYQKDFRRMIKSELSEDLFQMKMLYEFPCKTVH